MQLFCLFAATNNFLLWRLVGPVIFEELETFILIWAKFNIRLVTYSNQMHKNIHHSITSYT